MFETHVSECRAMEAESLERAMQGSDPDLNHLHETIARGFRLLADVIETGPSYQVVEAGDTASDTTLSGGIQYDFGTTNGMVISGGYQVVEAGGTAIDTTFRGGDQYVFGTAIDTTVNKNSLQIVGAGGTASDTTLSGGSEIVAAGGTVSGTITFVGSGQLTLEQSTNLNNFQIAGFNAPSDKLDLADIAYGPHTTLAFSEENNSTSGTLTVSDGVHTANVTLLGQYTAQNFTATSDGHGGTIVTDPPTLPAGVTLQQVDGGSNYYSNNGFTYAAAAGWDNAAFPVGTWLDYILSQSDVNRWLDLDLNTMFAMTSNTDLALLRANGIWAVQSVQPGVETTQGGVLPGTGTETVGLMSYDEPSTFSQGISTPLSTTPSSVHDGRFWWLNTTDSVLAYGGLSGTPSPGTATTDLAYLITTPDGSQRHIDVSSIDVYWFSGAKANVSGVLAFGLAPYYNLGRYMTPDEAARGSNYGAQIDMERAITGGTTPIYAFIEDGGPWSEDISASDYITPPELNWAVWSSLIHGARGIVYFNHTFAGPAVSGDNLSQPFYQTVQPGQTVSIYSQVQATDALIKQLAPVLDSPTALGFVTVSPAPQVLSGIETMVKDYNGQFYIFADTRDSETQTNISAVFTIADKNATSVTVVNENRTIPVVNGVFSDTFANGATVHIYQVNDGFGSSGTTSGGSGAPAITVTTSFSPLTIDTIAPAAPIITSDIINSDNSVSIVGTALDHGVAEAVDLIKIYDGSTQIGTTTTSSSGGWSYTTHPLSDVYHALTATVTDLAGNTSGPSQVVDPPIDPLAPVITSFSPNTGSVAGVADANSLTLAGTAEANTKVSIYDGSTLLGTTAANGSGTWSFVAPKLADGTHAYTTTDTDSAGLTSAPSLPFNVTVDTVKPADVATSATHNSNPFGFSNPTFTLKGTALDQGVAASGDVVKVYDGSTYLGSTMVGSNGTWSFTTAALSDTVHTFTSTATDVAGNIGQSSGAVIYGTSGNNTFVSTSGNNLVTGAVDTFAFNGTNFGKGVVDFWPHELDVFQFSNQNVAGIANVATGHLAEIIDRKDIAFQHDAGGAPAQSEGPGHGTDPSHFAHHWDLV